MSTHHVVAEPRGPLFTRPPLSCARLPAVDGAVRLKLAGELDLVTADLARDAIRRAQADGRTVICDLSDVRFVDVSGLRVLLDATANARLTGRRLTIANCPPIVPRMLKLLGLGDTLDIRRPLGLAVPECGQRRLHAR
jgi:anti-sigma B factor antagonist